MQAPWRVEPVAIALAFLTALNLCCTLWWKLTPAQTMEVMTSATTVVGAFLRGSVTSPATIHAAGETVSGLAARAAENTLAAKQANP
jgi:hypothetical protein